MAETSRFGPHLRRLREQRALTLRDLARFAGISAGYLSDVERGRRAPPGPRLVQTLAFELAVHAAPLHDLAMRERYWGTHEGPERAAPEGEHRDG